jgi:putative tricarboxylic transport membrane protein
VEIPEAVDHFPVNIKSKKDLVSAIFLAAFGIYVAYTASNLPYTSEFGPGPGFFPLWIGIGIVTCSLVMLWSCAVRGPTDGEQEIELNHAPVARALGAWSAFLAAVICLPLLGFAISLGLLTAFLIVVFDRRSPWIALSAAVGLALGFYLVFPVALGVSLPVGPWGF